MNTERVWSKVDSTLFTADGQENGVITVENTECFKVGMLVVLQSDSLQPTEYKVKQVLSGSEMALGPVGSKHKVRSDLTQWTLADNALVKATAQPRPAIDQLDYERAVYEEEPTMAKRVITVDKLGNTYGKSHQGQQQIVEGSVTGSVYNNLKLAYTPTLQVEYIATSPFATLDSENGHFIEKIIYDSVLNATRILLATSSNTNSSVRNVTITPENVDGQNFADIIVNTGEFLELESIDRFGSEPEGTKAEEELMEITVSTPLGLGQFFSGKIVDIISNTEIRVRVDSGVALAETVDTTKGNIITKANKEKSSLLQRSWDLREDYVYRVREDE